MFGQNFKHNLSLCNFSGLLFLKTTYGHSNVCVFLCRNNKLPIKLIIFSLSNKMV